MVTRLGDFLKFLVTNIFSIGAQLFGDFLGYLEASFFNTNCFGYFLSNSWWKFGSFLLQHLFTLLASDMYCQIIIFSKLT